MKIMEIFRSLLFVSQKCGAQTRRMMDALTETSDEGRSNLR